MNSSFKCPWKHHTYFWIKNSSNDYFNKFCVIKCGYWNSVIKFFIIEVNFQSFIPYCSWFSFIKICRSILLGMLFRNILLCITNYRFQSFNKENSPCLYHLIKWNDFLSVNFKLRNKSVSFHATFEMNNVVRQ